MAKLNPESAHVPKHKRDLSIAAHLDESLSKQYNIRSCRVIKGDTVRVMRGEYSGIEGKVESVSTATGTLAIEGIQREKVRGGNVKVKIHSSNVTISNLNTDDKYRQSALQGHLSKDKVRVGLNQKTGKRRFKKEGGK
jgi:large subunit ribosomal protein L24